MGSASSSEKAAETRSDVGGRATLGSRLLTRETEVAARVHSSFDRQAFMRTVGARLVSVEPRQVVLEWSFASNLTQQHGFLPAGVVAAVADSACGYAGRCVGIQVRATTTFGDPVDMGADEARAFAERIRAAADEADGR